MAAVVEEHVVITRKETENTSERRKRSWDSDCLSTGRRTREEVMTVCQLTSRALFPSVVSTGSQSDA